MEKIKRHIDGRGEGEKKRDAESLRNERELKYEDGISLEKLRKIFLKIPGGSDFSMTM